MRMKYTLVVGFEPNLPNRMKNKARIRGGIKLWVDQFFAFYKLEINNLV